MLVLARQRDQTVVIGDNVEVTIVDVRGDKVRLGINAPKNVSVHRKEVYDAIRRENASAAALNPGDIDAVPPSASSSPSPVRLQVSPLTAPENGRAHPAASNGSALDQSFMRAAIEEAKKGLAAGGLPIGSILVRNGLIVARGHTQSLQAGSLMGHAEIACLTNAGRQKTYRNTVLYSTLMPCYLCSGAIVQFEVPRVVVGESLNFPGDPDFMRKHGVEVVDQHDPECIAMLGDFIKTHPQLWHADIGK